VVKWIFLVWEVFILKGFVCFSACARARVHTHFYLFVCNFILPTLFFLKKLQLFPLMTSTCTTPNRPSGRAVDICYSINHQFI